ncbi:MAG: sulfite exporter TauE/SafE family protein [Gammaproteobacteria bacterium]
MFDLITIALIAGTFLLAGTVKGVIGLGLPTVSLGLLAATLDLTSAMALLLIPSFATNLWQAVVGGNGGAILRRLWPFFVLATATVWLGAMALTRVDRSLLSGLLGGLLMAYATLGLAGIRWVISAQQEIWAGPLFGGLNGIFTGMTGSFAVPGVLFLQALGLTRDMLVQAMGILFTVSTLALALYNNSLLTTRLSVLSVAAVLPAVLGMLIGQGIRQQLSEVRFRQIFFIALFILGGYIIMQSVISAS